MLGPRKVKYRKWHRKGVKGIATRKTSLSFGSFGLRATTGAWITARQIEAARRAMIRYIKRGGKMWIRIFPDHPVTIKGGEVKMGGGKGAVDHYVVPIKAGTILFELDGISKQEAVEALRLASHKLPVKTKNVIEEV